MLMNRSKKPAAGNPSQGSAHPEKGAAIKPGLPGAERSKAPATKDRDGRTAQDRDGNQEQLENPEKPR